MIAPGVLAPKFHAEALDGNPRYAFDTVAGRWIVLLLLGTAAPTAAKPALRLVERHRAMFDDEHACFFGVTVDRGDAAEGRVAQALPGVRWFLDYDRSISTLYGAVSATGQPAGYAPHWLLLDPTLRVHARAGLNDGQAIFDQLRDCLARGFELPTAPVLIIPNVLPSKLCTRLIELYQRDGGTESGFMREENGVTVARIDHGHKRRADYTIDDEQVLVTLKARMAEVLRPMVRHAFQFDATRIERFIVACYDAAHGGHFRAHRDNTTKGTAHRKFACTINLNADDYDGGDLRFPEFGQRTYRAPTGGAVVFSCSLLHQAERVTRGKRYAFLPFLYDDDGARLRERNLPFVAPALQGYRSGLPDETPTSH